MKTGLEKMVEWLENNEDEIDGGVAFDMIYEKAVRLVTEEKAQKPTAPASLEPKIIKVPCPKLVSQGGDGKCVLEGCDMASDEDYNKGKCVVEVPNPRYRPATTSEEGLREAVRHIATIQKSSCHGCPIEMSKCNREIPGGEISCEEALYTHFSRHPSPEVKGEDNKGGV